ncbi:hypothetical protein E1B28_003131 [Marasmius oreades]|uniref:Uncharacterized protein n=1 Tax=Marasmius oreades TaxID=181124 RepID=A0A9P7RL93_9AGAR|nr:uncharacterized protein E1B28_003131 [Marasmius oreades]KAG7085575.1 hypothetical protein E1B28_003131 [Marasmius oreades]
MTTSIPAQRPRKVGQSSEAPGSMHNLPPRESSPSPFRERPRTIKAASMSLVPSVGQVLAGQQPSLNLQSSPTSSNNSRRSPPYQSAGVVQRLLPTPPHPNPPNLPEQSLERRMSPPPNQHPANVSPLYPRPITRVPPPQFLTKFDMEEPWQMTEELLADIERADMQQSQGQAAPHSPHNFQSNFVKSDSPAKDPHVERVRSRERSSPKANEGSQLGRRQSLREQSVRESPKARERLPASPKRSTFSPVQGQTPERQASPPFNNSGLPSPGETLRHESSPVLRRLNGLVNDGRTNLSLATQTPPLQAINTRTPDRSLPVQEEPEDEHDNSSKDHNGEDDSYAHKDPGSPLPSSDLNPDPGRYDVSRTHGGRNSRAGHRKDDHVSYEDAGKRSTDDGGFTPRSNSVSLPDHVQVERGQIENRQQVNGGSAINHAANAATIRLNDSRRRSRNGLSDQMGLANLDTAFLQQPERHDQPSQYDPKAAAAQRAEAFALYAQQFHPDEIQSFMEHPTSSYIQAYLRSPRPDAPIPPTPHSQTSPPSPSPLLSGTVYSGTTELPPFTPVTPAGSPYPYPYSHVMRNHVQPARQTQNPLNLDLNNPSAIHEQFVKQWQIYAQNNHGHVSDSTLSPSSTPYPTPPFNPWAHWHTQRILGGRYGFPSDTATQRSSPSHEPIELPAPPMLGLKKKVPSPNLRSATQTTASIRKPPPRVESTQPRETSPEPSSSGEETAGEDRFAVPEEGDWVNSHSRVPSESSNGIIVNEADDEDEGEWVEEDWDDDEDDLLDLEYHPSFVNNIEKRRRRFETRWDALMHAFQALDRQTDATMVLLAAPSHTTKLHMATSRSIRRQTTLSRSSAMSSLRSGFHQVATERRTMRSRVKTSLADRFLMSSGASGDGSDSSESREADLKRALDAALGSLGVLGNMYERREARWMEEMRRIGEDRERVELLLKQALGASRD